MKYLVSILHVALIAGLTALTLYAIRRSGARRRPAELGVAQGRITPGKISAGLFAAMGVALFAIGAFALASGAIVPGMAMAGLGLSFVAMMVPSLGYRHDVTWDEHGVTGPDRLSLGMPGRSRTHIAWRDIAATGRVAVSGHDYVESRFGTRIYWSYLYPGHGFLEQAIAVYRANPPNGLRG